MLFKIWGKGIVCNVYYIEQKTLQEISDAVSRTGAGLKQLLTEHSDYIVNVSKGFFADSSLFEFEYILSNGEIINKSFFDEKVANIAEHDGDFCEFEDARDYRVTNHSIRVKDITESQVAIIEYHEFEEGHISIEIPCDEKYKIEEMKLVCESVDGAGPNGVDLASKATYQEGIVGGEEYEYSEAAIMGLEIDGNNYLLPEATFEKSRSRVWLWVYDEETDEHSLDFFGSQELPDPWVVDLIDLSLDDIYESFDQDLAQLSRVQKFFNQKDLSWIKECSEYTKKYLECHLVTKSIVSKNQKNFELPEFRGENITFDTCKLLCMFFEALGVTGYDAEKLSNLEEFDMMSLDFETLSLGNKSLSKSVQQSFCMHFNVIYTVSFGDEVSFQEMSNPSLADAIHFVKEVLNDPNASFNQGNS